MKLPVSARQLVAEEKELSIRDPHNKKSSESEAKTNKLRRTKKGAKRKSRSNSQDKLKLRK